MWKPLATLSLNKGWSLTLPVTGSLFRVGHILTPANDLRQGYIAQASAYAPLEILGIRKLYSKQEYDIYEFIQPICWSERVIAVKNGFYYSPNSWAVSIDVWE